MHYFFSLTAGVGLNISSSFLKKNFLAVRSGVKTKIHCILGCVQHLCIYVKTNSKFCLSVWGDCFALWETSIKMFDTGMQIDR